MHTFEVPTMSTAEGGTWKTMLVPISVVAAALLAAWPALVAYEVKKLEKPKYRVIKTLLGKKNKVEIRTYEPYVVAEYEAKEGTDMDRALSGGFRAIAGYIFGRDQPETTKEKIAMTSPVRLEMEGERRHKVSFVMPSKYNKDNLPPCSNQEVNIREVDATTVAALTFSGSRRSITPKTIEEKKNRILDVLKENDLVGVPETVMVYQYHPPFTLGFLRKNEVLLEVKEAST